ncbi:MAG: hypothetical protein N2038_00050 [Geminicoccaceae bacterium]|nr:hypothetical protein [Geminicoccaceae bacterium]MCS7267306.1 hypothetical protein [Geminicoccaceae bacterium]MCX7628622.1 hypothetical protein [Geminicoccaceae bacterium]MDW8124835.1 hypothetical protein [Geminicoccaceae bacterium]MDW8340641.1 hypothetical protein [Geminicoccaceae bacterium]
MNPSFFLIRPPRAADGPVPRVLWLRLARATGGLLLFYLAATLLAAS